MVGLVDVGLVDVDFGGGGGVEELLVVGAAEEEEVSTVPGVYPGKRLIVPPAAAGRTTWFPMGSPALKAKFRELSSTGQ